MEYILFAVIVLQLLYIVYSDFQNRKERELLQLKLMSADATDYRELLGDTPEDSPKEEEDPYISLDEAGIERVVKAKDKL
jgi:hypothetical protein